MTNLALQLIAHEKKEKTGKLDLGKCGLTQLPKELFELDWLEELVVSNHRWDVVKQQWKESLNSGSNNYLHGKLPDDFKKLNRLKKLYLGGSGYVQVSELFNFQDSWEINDVSILAHLTSFLYPMHCGMII